MILNSAPLNAVVVNGTAGNAILSLRVQGGIYLDTNATNYLHSVLNAAESSFNSTSEGRYFLRTTLASSANVSTTSQNSSAVLKSLFSSLDNSVRVDTNATSYFRSLMNATTTSFDSTSNGKYVLKTGLTGSANVGIDQNSRTALSSSFSSLDNPVNVDSTANIWIGTVLTGVVNSSFTVSSQLANSIISLQLNSAPSTVNVASQNSLSRLRVAYNSLNNSVNVDTNATNYLYFALNPTVSSFNSISNNSKYLLEARLASSVGVSTTSQNSLSQLLVQYNSLNNSIAVSSIGNLYNYTAYNPNSSTLGIRNISFLTPASLLKGTASRFNTLSLDSRTILEARMASIASMNTDSADSKTFLETVFRSLNSTVGLNYTVSSLFFTNFHGTPSSFKVNESSKVYPAMYMDGLSFLDPIVTSSKEYQIVTLADFISDEKAYTVDSVELNYYPEKVILDFYPEKIMLDLYSSTDSLELNA